MGMCYLSYPHYQSTNSLQNSVYSLFPFFTPSKMKTALKAQGLDAKYVFDRPVIRKPPVVLNDFTAIKYAFNDPERFKIIYDKVGYGSVLTSDNRAQYVGR